MVDFSCVKLMKRLTAAVLIQTTWLVAASLSAKAEMSPNSSIETCMKELVLSAPEDMTVKEMRKNCMNNVRQTDAVIEKKSEKNNAVKMRLRVDEENVLRPFTIMAHQPNYFLFGAHNFQGYSDEEYVEASGVKGIDVDKTEAQFQLSIKTPLAVNLFNKDVDIFAAYSVRSFWQVYNTDISSPFRETNHEPEVWVQGNPNLEIFGFKSEIAAFGFVHQSNGQSRNLSRSWNRIYANFIFNRGNLAFSFLPWIRIHEDEETDDNPDITDYMGHGQFRFAYKYRDHTISFMSRNNLESGFSRGAVELGWSFPLFKYPFLKGYVQYFSGYGESLIDYDRYVNRLGLGILLTDFL